jgi:hypothetical protein
MARSKKTVKNVLTIFLLAVGSASAGQGFAVVELFTSQGCSSCPAADKNLTTLLRESEKAGTPVFALSFHVDYWNHLGWKDPYSSKEFTERQKTYGGIMNLNSLYTPQMIVNGESEFVGSDLAKAKKFVAAALQQQHSMRIQVSNLVIDDGFVTFDYSLNQDLSDGFLNAAIIGTDNENFVAKGENKGKILHHTNVVTGFMTVSLKKKDHLRIRIPQHTGGDTAVIFYAQDEQLRILAATSLPLK